MFLIQQSFNLSSTVRCNIVTYVQVSQSKIVHRHQRTGIEFRIFKLLLRYFYYIRNINNNGPCELSCLEPKSIFVSHLLQIVFYCLYHYVIHILRNAVKAGEGAWINVNPNSWRIHYWDSLFCCLYY